MKSEKYETLYDNSNNLYEFLSIGPKGIIKKVIQFEKINGINKNIYNLTLGDLNEIGRINDLVVSNNNDTAKVLYTVAFTILEFANRFPNASVLIEGSTNSRTRLYQMAIGKNVEEINKFFDIKGLKNGYWENFKPGINFEAFLIKYKPIKL